MFFVIAHLKLLKNKRFILDLGSTPGGWSQVLSEKVKKGKILAIDILPMEKIDNVDFILGDFLEEDIKKRIFKIFHNKIDVVISDNLPADVKAKVAEVKSKILSGELVVPVITDPVESD